MASITAIAEMRSVGMGQIAVGRPPIRLSSVLGSCVGVVLYHPRLHAAVLGHVVLPRAKGAVAAPGKFADTAIPHMLQLMERELGSTAGLAAKIAGGACMFGNATGPMQIGQSNIEAVTQALESAGLHVVAKDVGGAKGRRIIFDCQSGTLTVEIAGTSSRTL